MEKQTIASYGEEVKRLEDRYAREEHRKCVNDLYAEEAKKRRRGKNDRNLLRRVIPFDDRDRDLGEWLYDNKYGVIAVSLSYLLFLVFVMYVRYDIHRPDLRDSILIEIPLEEAVRAEPQPEPERRPAQEAVYEEVVNAARDENNKLDEELEDDRGLRSSDLYAEAQRIQEQMENNNRRYLEGLQAIEEERAERENNLTVEKNDRRETVRNTLGPVVSRGNVTVSYDLKGRKAVYLEVPAYRCEGGGRVVVGINVAPSGKVTGTSVESTDGVSDSCVPEMALEAAKKCRFTERTDSLEKQRGTITFVFVAQ